MKEVRTLVKKCASTVPHVARAVPAVCERKFSLVLQTPVFL